MPTTPLGIARTVGKVILAIALAYAALMLASLAGGRLASALGVIFHLSSVTIASLKWAFPVVIFLGIFAWLYIWEKPGKGRR